MPRRRLSPTHSEQVPRCASRYGLRPARLAQRLQHNSKEVPEPAQPLHLSTADPTKVGFHPWLNIQSARWLKFGSAPTNRLRFDAASCLGVGGSVRRLKTHHLHSLEEPGNWWRMCGRSNPKTQTQPALPQLLACGQEAALAKNALLRAMRAPGEPGYGLSACGVALGLGINIWSGTGRDGDSFSP